MKYKVRLVSGKMRNWDESLIIHPNEIRVFLEDFRDSLKVLEQGKNMTTFAFQSSTSSIGDRNKNKAGSWIVVMKLM